MRVPRFTRRPARQSILGPFPRPALILALALCLLPSLFAAESKAPEPVGPPQPRVVAPLQPQPLPPRATDPSWLLFQRGVRLFGDRSLGEALLAFKQAIDARSSLFDRASADIAAAVAAKEAGQARGSISTLVALLAARDLIRSDYQDIHAQAAGSLVAEMGLLRERSPSAPLRGLIDATLLVVEERGLSRLGDSLEALRKAALNLSHYPEAEFWIGRVYQAEGESRLAELQMLHALDMGASLEVPEDRFAMLEDLAAIYKIQGDLKDYELRLREVADASDLFAGKDQYYRNALERILANQGFDKFMALYRIQESKALDAYSKLGEFYLEARRPLATLYLAASVNAMLTREIEGLRVDSPSFAYTSLSDLAARIQGDRQLSGFAAEKGLWRDLLLLGEALAAAGNRDTAREIWTVLTKTPGIAEPWGRRAAAALLSSRSASRLPQP
jgi:hypothetical protein